VLTPEGDILKPGIGKGQTSFGELTGERSGRCEEIGAALVAGGIQATISDNIVAEMWAKFTGIAAAAAISTLTRARAGETPSHRGSMTRGNFAGVQYRTRRLR